VAYPQVFIAGMIVGAIIALWLRRKLQKMVPGRAQAEKAKGIMDHATEWLLGKKKKK
jgi:hypothetical protein